jgi:hypothetical protein
MGCLVKCELQIVVVPYLDLIFQLLPVDIAVPIKSALSSLSSELTTSTFAVCTNLLCKYFTYCLSLHLHHVLKHLNL